MGDLSVGFQIAGFKVIVAFESDLTGMTKDAITEKCTRFFGGKFNIFIILDDQIRTFVL